MEANYFDVSRRSTGKSLYKCGFFHTFILRAFVVFICPVDGYPVFSIFLPDELDWSWTPQNHSDKGKRRVLPCVSTMYHWLTGL